MADLNHLFGSCACERNVYEITVPSASTSLAQVFFDNSTASRRATATPVTAWLRVPLTWYQSATLAQFPDESHSSIKRSFNAPAPNPLLPPTRRQFCGYCGTSLTAWNEALHAGGYGNNQGHDYLDVTLGSLLDESLERLEALKILPDDSDEGSVQSPAEGLSRSGTINEEDHIETNERRPGGVDEPSPPSQGTPIPVRTSTREVAPHRMQSRGVPYFEEMIEHSRLGRIRRQRGGHTCQDGTTSVQWEVIEIGDDEQASSVTDIGGNKRLRIA